jgi:hypothetical protein
MLMSVAAAVIGLQLGALSHMQGATTPLIQVQQCGNGYDLDIHGRCFPNGVIPPRYQASRQGRYYGGGRYPIPCGNGADLDTRDGQCYPTGTVPPQFQEGRQQYYGDDEGYQPRPRRRYYYGN